jgi:Holliday junction resolvasome RuvABC endonuclease subunit
MPGILALDPGTAAFGWSHFLVGRARPDWGHTRIGTAGDESGKVGAALTIFLEARIAALQPDAIAFESVYVPTPRKPRFVKGGSPFVFGAETVEQADTHIPMNARTVARLYGIAFLIRTIAYQHQIPCEEATTGAFCTYFLGRKPPKGREAKKAANVEMCRILGWTPVTQDEADALALGSYAEAKLFPSLRGPLFVEKVS